MKRALSYFSLAIVLAASVPGSAQPGVTHGAELASACTACHGVTGRSRGAIPPLAGIKHNRFRERMQAFQQGEGTIMNRIAPAYDDRDIAALADYFASQSARQTNE